MNDGQGLNEGYDDDDDIEGPEVIVARKKKEDPTIINLMSIADINSVKEAMNGAQQSATEEHEKIMISDTPGEHLTPDDFRQADFVNDYNQAWNESGIDPIEGAGLYEGDIDNVLVDDLIRLQNDPQRNAIRDSWRTWKNGIIPYVISSAFGQHERSIIAKAMKQYHDKTCIRFRPRTSEIAYIHIIKGKGCSSSVGRTGSQQTVSLGNGCVYTGIVQHELMHASGFWHEQSRADRDDHITINWHNIQNGMEYNFLKYDLRRIDHLGATYDTCSVMHYGKYAFSKGREETISPKHKTACKLGQRQGFSDTDIRKLNTLYKCRGYPQVGSGNGISVTSKPRPQPTSKPWVKPNCMDQNKYCATWADKTRSDNKGDQCRKNPSWMLVHCPVSCNQCDNKCEDNNVFCKDWADMKECEKNPDYMNIYCSKSCKKCRGDNNCEDENNDCKSWSKKGYCTRGKYMDYMQLRCKKSCKLC